MRDDLLDLRDLLIRAGLWLLVIPVLLIFLVVERPCRRCGPNCPRCNS